MTPRLQNAIEKSYAAFGWRGLEAPLEVCHCSCCMTWEMSKSILTTPLRELSNEQLSEYTNSAHGWSNQFLYLMPRYMELVAKGERPTYIDADYIFSRFCFAPENCMTAAEAAALDEWLLALFEDTLCSPITPVDIDSALAQQSNPWWKGFGEDVCEIIEIALPTPFDTAQLQSLWGSCETLEANLRLAITLAFGIGAQHFTSRHVSSERVRQQAADWYEWFTLEDHTERLTRAFERATDPRAQELLLLAL